MQTILIVGAIQAFFFSFLLFNKKNRKPADSILFGWFLLIGFHQLYYFFASTKALDQYPIVYILGNSLPFVHGPFIYWYIKSLISIDEKISYWNLLHLLPYFLDVCIGYWHYLSFPDMVIFTNGFYMTKAKLPDFVDYLSYFKGVQGGAYPLINLWMLHKHKNKIRESFSYEEEVGLKWLRELLIGTLLGFLIIFFTTTVIFSSIHTNIELIVIVISLTLTIHVLYIGFFGLKQTLIFSSIQFPIQAHPSKKRYASSVLTADEIDKTYSLLQAAMVSNQYYLDSKLTLSKLSKHMDITPNALSRVINEKFGANFFDYINDYRVHAFKEKVNDPSQSHYTLLGLALESGFSSKSSFNLVFKNNTGMTPSQYKKSIQQNNQTK